MSNTSSSNWFPFQRSRRYTELIDIANWCEQWGNATRNPDLANLGPRIRSVCNRVYKGPPKSQLENQPSAREEVEKLFKVGPK